MADLSYLTSQLRYWENQVNALNNKIKKLKRRKKDVQAVISNLKGTAPKNASDINGKLKQAALSLDMGINYSGRDSQINSIFSNKNDKGFGDSNVSSANNELQRELNDIDRKIEEAQRELNRAKERVKEYKSAVAVEKAHLRAMAKISASGGSR